MNNNNFEINITIKGLEVTSNGCTCEDIQFTSKGNFGNEYVAVLGEALNHMLTKIPDAEPCFKENFCEAETTSTPTTTPTVVPKVSEAQKINQVWDLPAIWGVMMKSLPDGFKKTGIGSYTFETTEEKVKNKIKVQIEFNEDSIDMDIYTGSTAIHGYLYSEAKRSRITGINPALMDDMFEEMPDEIKEFVKNYFDRITK